MVKDAVIVGGSIAGLMCAIMLKHHGYNVTVLEQDTSAFRQGYDAGIHTGPVVQEFLKKHNRVQREDVSITCTPGFKISLSGDPTPQRGQTMVNTSWGLFINILRANFDGLTSKAVPVAPVAQDGDGKAVFKNGARVTALHEEEGKIHVQYENVLSNKTESVAADLAIVADGSVSSIRSILMPDVQRKYAGYICWRGAVPEELVEEKWNKLYSEKATFHFMKNSYILAYTIPTDDGNLSQGKRLHNWIWYSDLPEDSTEMAELFTDIHGKTHKGTVPREFVRPEVWEKKKADAAAMLPEGLADIVQKSPSPFITKIYDISSPKALFCGGKVFLVGDAQVTLRPNVGMSSAHAAFDCNTLEQVIEGTLTPEQWEKRVLRWGAAKQRFAITITSYGFGRRLALVWNLVRWLLLLLGQKLGLA